VSKATQLTVHVRLTPTSSRAM